MTLRGCLLAALALAACNGRFDFDTEPLGGGAAGAPPATGGSAGATAMPDRCAACEDFGLRCATDSHSCVECLDGGDCHGSTPYCDPMLHRCTPCASPAAGCDRGSVCSGWSHSCVRSCASDVDPDHDCHGTTLSCDYESYLCVECHSDYDCQDSGHGKRCPQDGSRCVECVSDGDCPGRHCDTLAFACVDCRDSNDCAGTLVCDPDSHGCVGREDDADR